MSLTPRTDREARALALLPQQFKGKANAEAGVSLVAGSSGSQEFEDAAVAVRDECSIDDGVGTQLDNEGTIVEQPRISADDEEYRDALRTKVAINTAQGDIEKLISVAQSITGADTVHYRRWGLAHCSVCCIGAVLRTTELSRLEKVVPAHVSLEVNAAETVTPFTLGRAVDAAGAVDSIYNEDLILGEGFGTVDVATGLAIDGGEMVATYVEAGT